MTGTDLRYREQPVIAQVSSNRRVRSLNDSVKHEYLNDHTHFLWPKWIPLYALSLCTRNNTIHYNTAMFAWWIHVHVITNSWTCGKIICPNIYLMTPRPSWIDASDCQLLYHLCHQIHSISWRFDGEGQDGKRWPPHHRSANTDKLREFPLPLRPPPWGSFYSVMAAIGRCRAYSGWNSSLPQPPHISPTALTSRRKAIKRHK